jgi:CBS domain-containing protein
MYVGSYFFWWCAMKAKDLMSRDLTSVREEAPLKEAAAILSQNELSGVPVLNASGQAVGFISEKDIISSTLPNGAHILNPEIISLANLSQVVKKLSRVGAARVKDYMSETLYYVTEDAPLSDVIELMLEKDLKRLPVLRDKKLVGMIERANLTKAALEEKQ